MTHDTCSSTLLGDFKDHVRKRMKWYKHQWKVARSFHKSAQLSKESGPEPNFSPHWLCGLQQCILDPNHGFCPCERGMMVFSVSYNFFMKTKMTYLYYTTKNILVITMLNNAPEQNNIILIRFSCYKSINIILVYLYQVLLRIFLYCSDFYGRVKFFASVILS